MKRRKSIERLLSFLLTLSLMLGVFITPIYAVDEERTASFDIRESNGQTGIVQYKLNGSGDFQTATNGESIALDGVTSITIKTTPIEDAKVNQNNCYISGTEQAVNFDYDALVSESGWTYQIQDNDGNITFTIEFDNHDGTGGGENPPLVEGPAIVFSADPNADGTLTVSNGIFTLSNDTSVLGTVQVTLIDALNNKTPYTGNDEVISLNEISSVRIVMHPTEGLNANIVTPGDPPEGALSEAEYDSQENTYTFIADPTQFGEAGVLYAFIWFGYELPPTDYYFVDFTTAPWTIDDVEVDIEGRTQDTELVQWLTITDVISLINFDHETMDAVLIVDENVTLHLNVDEDGNTRLEDVEGGVEVLPPSGAMTFSVIKKAENQKYTLVDSNGNSISFLREEGRTFTFTIIDYLTFTDEELEDAGIPEEMYDTMLAMIKEVTKAYGELLSFYEIMVENDDSFLEHEGPFEIKIKMTEEMKKYNTFKIIYTEIDNNVTLETPIVLTQVGDELVGTLEHLSTYALVGTYVENTPTASTTPNYFVPNTGVK